MKILFLNYEYPPLGGGAGNATEYLLKEYARVPDLEVHLVTSSADAEAHEIAVGGKVFVHSLPIGKSPQTLHFQSIFDILRYSWVGYRFGSKLLSTGRFDAIHAFFSVPCGVQAYLLGKKFKIPYIVSLRGADVPGYSERFSLLYIILRPIIRCIWKCAAHVVANSSGLRQLALQTNPKQMISVIPNGVETKEFKPAAAKEIDGYVRILCVSRLTPRKGIRYLIEAMQMLLAKDASRKVELWIAGEGSETESLKQLVNELGIAAQVKFFGRVPHEKLAAYYQTADIFCLPSLNEGMSNTMLEALASGMPIVATDTGGTQELVTDGENGFIVKMKSVEDIAEKLERLIGDPELRQRFGAASRRHAETMSWENIADQYVRKYGEAVSEVGRMK